QADDGIRDFHVTGVQTCALPIWGIILSIDGSQLPLTDFPDGERNTGLHILDIPAGVPVQIDPFSIIVGPKLNCLMSAAKFFHMRSEERRVGKESSSLRPRRHITK